MYNGDHKTNPFESKKHSKMDFLKVGIQMGRYNSKTGQFVWFSKGWDLYNLPKMSMMVYLAAILKYPLNI